MITTNFETFEQRSKEMAWTKTPSQKIDGGGVSSQWGGTHTHFREPEPSSPRRDWQIGTGRCRDGKKNYESSVERSAGYIYGCTEDYVRVNGKKAPGRTRQFNDFVEKAKKGDIIFLHHKKVTHWGRYTGEILSHREGYNDPDYIPKGWSDAVSANEKERKHVFHIKVEQWIPVSQPFTMTPRVATLFEVTNNPIYQNPLSDGNEQR